MLSISEKELYAGLDTGKIIVIDTSNGAIKSEYEFHKGRVTGLAISDDETKMISVSFDSSFAVWSTGTIRNTTQSLSFHTNRN